MLTGARIVAGAAFTAAIALTPCTPAMADPGFGAVDCDRRPATPVCAVSAGTPESPGGGNGDDPGGSGTANGCYYRPVGDGRPPPLGAASGGGWYVKICPTSDGGMSQSEAVWLDAPPVADPAVLARLAVSRLRLPAPAIRVNPTPPAKQLAYLPTWLWLDISSWQSQTTTASVPGLSVTARARPSRLLFTTGDGRSVTCPGPGTAWNAGTDPNAASPTCGHTYTRPGTFSLTATVTWQISWAGGGQAGTVPDLVTTSTVALEVTESQALNTNP